MSLNDKLKQIKKEFFSYNPPINRDFEFNATLENHQIGNQNIYRLYYINYHRIGENFRMEPNNIGVINWSSKPFTFPNGMTREEGFQVLSYLTDFIEKRPDIDSCSLKSVKTLDTVLDLERFGFTRVNETNENKILNLFTIDGRLLLFKKSELYSKYFEWYMESVSLKTIINIYAKYGIEFHDIVWLDNQNNKEYTKVLKK